MHAGRIIFSQLLDFVPKKQFDKCVRRYRGNHRIKTFSCFDQYLCMAFAQITYRQSLRDTETCLRAMQPKLYHCGIRGNVSRTTLAKANENRNWRIYADFVQILINKARMLYADEDFGIQLNREVYALDPTTVKNCIISDNYARRGGGGLYNYNDDMTITDCIFAENQCAGTDKWYGGAGIHMRNASSTITDCIFVENTSTNKAFGGAIENLYSSPTITGCIFVGNSVGSYFGGGICNVGYDHVDGGVAKPTITSCIFSGNTAVSGGAIGNVTVIGSPISYAEPSVINCLMVGNAATSGGGTRLYRSKGTYTNCMMRNNHASDNGGGINTGDSSETDFENCIVYGNTSINDGCEIYIATGTTVTVTNCDIQGGWDDATDVYVYDEGTIVDGGDNIAGDPSLKDSTTGSWSSDATYSSTTFKSTLTDSGAGWSPDQFAGDFVNPDVSQYLQFYIVSNTSNTLTVWGDASSIAHNNDNYAIYDYHFKDGTSPCIDAGRNDFISEPNDLDGNTREVDGDCDEETYVDMGAYEYQSTCE